jgi:hypothetical protein
MEDVLTSSILGTIKYLPERLACSLLSQFAGLPAVEGIPEVDLWPRYPTPTGFGGSTSPSNFESEVDARGDTEPDALIHTDSWLVLVEAKYRSPLDSEYDQLGREFVIGYRLAQQMGLRFRLVVITAQACAPTPGGMDLITGLQRGLRARSLRLGSDALRLIDSVPDALHWTNWQAIYRIMSHLDADAAIPSHAQRLLGDACRLLELRGLRPYSVEPLLGAMLAWDAAAIQNPASLLSFHYRSPISATLAASWRVLHALELQTLKPETWRFSSSGVAAGYHLAGRTSAFSLESLKDCEWRFSAEKGSEA